MYRKIYRIIAITLVLVMMSVSYQGNQVLAKSQNEQTESHLSDKLINYITIAEPSQGLDDVQTIVVGVGNGEKDLSEAVLYYRNETSNDEYVVKSSDYTDDAYLFKVEYKDSQKGIYTLTKITYSLDKKKKTVTLDTIGLDVSWGVAVEYESDADAYVENIQETDGQQDAVFEVTTAEGEDYSASTVAEALELASQDIFFQRRARTNDGNVVVFLDPGHDDTHAGARANGLCEEKLTLKIAQYCKEELETYDGITVYMCRESGACPNPGMSSGDDNAARVSRAASLGADVYISIHLNSWKEPAASGVEIYYPNPNYNSYVSSSGKGIAQAILENIVELGLNNRGLKMRYSDDSYKYPDGSTTDYYGVIRNAKLRGVPGIIIEHAFLTNPSDAALLSTEEGLKALGQADAQGIASYYGLVRKIDGVFDAKFYYDTYPDLRASIGFDETKLLKHYLKYGINEGRTASPVFNITCYVNNNPDLQKTFGEDLIRYAKHFAQYGMNEGRQACPSFDVWSYKNAHADLRHLYNANMKSYYMHYIQYGYYEGRVATGVPQVCDPITESQGVDYRDVYDYYYYVEHNPDVGKAYPNDDVATLTHFIRYGMKEGRIAKKDFDVNSYRNRYADLRKAYGDNLSDYFYHYIKYGKKEGRKGTYCPTLQGTSTRYNGTDYSAVYDFNYYITNNPDVYEAYGNDDDAVLGHFVKYGMNEGRQANTKFNPESYRRRYVDLRQVYGNSLRDYYLHYMNYGMREGRDGGYCAKIINPVTTYNGMDYCAVYDFEFYVKNNPDVLNTLGYDDEKVLEHFVRYGMDEGRRAKSTFDVWTYMNKYEDLRNAYQSSLKDYYIHYVNYGEFEGRQGV